MNYNKIPFKERKRNAKYQFELAEKQEEIHIKKMIKQQEEEKRRCYEVKK